MENVADALKDLIPPVGAYACTGGCGGLLKLPGRCDSCTLRAIAVEREKRVRAWLRGVPERYRDARWEDLSRLTTHDGSARVMWPPQGSSALRRALARAPRAVLIGPAGSGKTSVAIAHLRAVVEQRPDARVRFVPATDLAREETPEGGPTPMALALSADVLVLDDLGAELEHAGAGTGLLAQRVGPACKVIAERFDRCLPLVVTTGLERDKLELLYSDRIARRLFEGALVARLGAVPGGAR